jgi:hypothetical protein
MVSLDLDRGRDLTPFGGETPNATARAERLLELAREGFQELSVARKPVDHRHHFSGPALLD